MSDSQKYHLLKYHEKPSENSTLEEPIKSSRCDGLRNVVGGWSTVTKLMVHFVYAVLYSPTTKREGIWVPW